MCKNYIFFIATYWYVLSTSHKNTKAFVCYRSIYIDRYSIETNSICTCLYFSIVARLVLAVRSQNIPPPASTVESGSLTLESIKPAIICPLSSCIVLLLLLLQKKRRKKNALLLRSTKATFSTDIFASSLSLASKSSSVRGRRTNQIPPEPDDVHERNRQVPRATKLNICGYPNDPQSALVSNTVSFHNVFKVP